MTCKESGWLSSGSHNLYVMPVTFRFGAFVVPYAVPYSIRDLGPRNCS